MKHIIRIDRLSFFQDKHSINDCLPLQANDLIFDKGHISIYLVTEVPDIVPIPHIQLETFIAHLADITDRPIQTTYLIRQSNLTQDVGSTFIKELEREIQVSV